ncbi:acetyltransferase [Bacillus manliponensis]|uniref:Acetyltransferase n=1 Tax=Bacillus manliponensis TaxID=574376 RepID=A0A073KCM4_9BACI|nr:GNAT family N-acetyltransferase [Bacillus manliponensis]KEK20038.1 acetyltransferase [Bacillus manliponensis]
MIRKLTNQDNQQVLSYLKRETAMNLFLIGDIEAFGYDTDFQELWGQFTEDNELRGVLLRFHDSFIPYAAESFSLEEFASKIDSNSPIKISGKSEVVEQFEAIPTLTLGEKRRLHFAECTNDNELDFRKNEENIKIATIDDVPNIMKLRKQIVEFTLGDESEKLLRQAIETNTGRTYYIEKDGEMVACASTSAENSLSAMVVGVCTHDNYRGKGYASQLLSKMIEDFTAEGRSLCLFYDNPAAGRIYKRLGFKDIGTWTMYR